MPGRWCAVLASASMVSVSMASACATDRSLPPTMIEPRSRESAVTGPAATSEPAAPVPRATTGGTTTGGTTTGGTTTAPSNGADTRAATDDLPEILNYSASSDAHIVGLARQALAGLGFPTGDEQGPLPDDLVFVGRFYMAWLDQTGFFGEMNGLWRLNGLAADALDFAVRDEERPVNFLIVGEFGDGRWAPGYSGADHIEFPSRTPEADDPPTCASTDWCNQYGLAEAAPITDPDVPWWSACNRRVAGWNRVREPVERATIPGGLRVVWEGRLVKVADGDGTFDGDACERDWLFADGLRRPVMLRVGYELYGNVDHLDRVLQFRNPADNPPFSGPMSLIGGFVVTAWPEPHPLKRIATFVRPESAAIDNDRYGISLPAGEFTRVDFAALRTDVVMAWLDQPITLSVSNDYITGRSATVSNVGPSDNACVGICLGEMHGAIELGGGLIHGGISLPIEGGASSIEARRRLELPGAHDGVPVTRSAEAETDLLHEVGRPDGDGWSASVTVDDPGYLVVGPAATDWGGGAATVDARLMVDDHTGDEVVVTLVVFDVTAGQVLASRAIRRNEFAARMTYQSFEIEFELTGACGHALTTRVWWHGNAYVRVDRLTVTTID